MSHETTADPCSPFPAGFYVFGGSGQCSMLGFSQSFQQSPSFPKGFLKQAAVGSERDWHAELLATGRGGGRSPHGVKKGLGRVMGLWGWEVPLLPLQSRARLPVRDGSAHDGREQVIISVTRPYLNINTAAWCWGV